MRSPRWLKSIAKCSYSAMCSTQHRGDGRGFGHLARLSKDQIVAGAPDAARSTGPGPEWILVWQGAVHEGKQAMVVNCEHVWKEISNYLDDDVDAATRAAM